MSLFYTEDFSVELEPLRERLKRLEGRFNPEGLNLHFGAPKGAHVCPGLWAGISELAREGLGRIEEHREYFLKAKAPSAMYDDGMYWYDLFLFIGAVSIAQANYGDEIEEPDPAISRSVAESLIAISEYTAVVPGDISKRNWEALANFLIAFPQLCPAAAEIIDTFDEGNRKDILLSAVRTAGGTNL